MRQERVVLLYADDRSLEETNKQFEELAKEGYTLAETITLNKEHTDIIVYRFTREVVIRASAPVQTHNCHCFLTPPYTVTCAIGQPTPTILK